MAKPQSYQIIIEKKAEKEAENVPPPQRHRIDKAIRSLSVNPRPVAGKKLAQKEGYVQINRFSSYHIPLVERRGSSLYNALEYFKHFR